LDLHAVSQNAHAKVTPQETIANRIMRASLVVGMGSLPAVNLPSRTLHHLHVCGLANPALDPYNSAAMSNATPARIELDLDAASAHLAAKEAPDIVRWTSDFFGAGLVMTSSFGAQSLVMLHLVTRIVPDIPVIFIDTGYHFPETYQFCDEWTTKLNLNLKVYQAALSPAWMESRIGKLWEGGKEDLDHYDRIRKVEPQRRALRELGAAACLAGNRAQQTEHRAGLRHVELIDGVYQVYPILRWTTRQVHHYLKQHGLPYHPLYDQGYKSIGDWHSTFKVGDDQHERAGRFRGLKQECGLHLPTTADENQSREGSSL
jgi:phosphoadenosine phosphosulfate reductase